jgi:hypothetical protein
MPPINEWTVMFFCAGDNELAPLIISQLKGIKDAGANEDVDVLVYLDPNEKGVPTRIYSVNQDGRAIDPNNPFVPNLENDNIAISRSAVGAAKRLKAALRNPDKVQVKEALRRFLRFCKQKHRANHYALVLLGHGMIVANDAFLPDEFPVSSVTLKQLGANLDIFDGKLELLAFHSCSMSAVEVAYELKGKANYMIASEGMSFVGSWPYRNLLVRLFNFVERSQEPDAEPESNDVPRLIQSLYNLAYYNAKDFMLSGYSLDLALCSLDPRRYGGLTTAIKRLVMELRAALDDLTGKQLIQLAHLESQSYYDENYTDLYDFCDLLAGYCTSRRMLPRLRIACETVKNELKPLARDEPVSEFDGIVVHSRHFGSQYQYSHGLSVYFPWSKPLGNLKDSVLEKYKGYAFTKALGNRNSWLNFLNLYLDKTQRDPRPGNRPIPSAKIASAKGALDKISGRISKPSGGSGAGCTCPSIKNFPTEEKTIKGEKKRVPKYSMTPTRKPSARH